MRGLEDGAFSRPVAAMTLSECVSELEALDRELERLFFTKLVTDGIPVTMREV